MKAILLLVIVFLTLTSCKEKQNSFKEALETQALKDSIKEGMKAKIKAKLFEEAKTNDTLGMHTSPVQVTKAIIVKSDGGSYRNVQLAYKNVSDKIVVACRFSWKGSNAFLEPADMGNNYLKGYGSGFTEDVMRPGTTNYGTFEVLSKDAKTLDMAWPTEVVYQDGTKWLQEDYK